MYMWEFELDWWFDGSEKTTDKGVICAEDEIAAMRILINYYGNDIDCIKWLKACSDSEILMLDGEYSDENCRYKLIEKC